MSILNWCRDFHSSKPIVIIEALIISQLQESVKRQVGCIVNGSEHCGIASTLSDILRAQIELKWFLGIVKFCIFRCEIDNCRSWRGVCIFSRIFGMLLRFSSSITANKEFMINLFIHNNLSKLWVVFLVNQFKSL